MPKHQTRINYHNAINAVAGYIDQNYEQKLALPDLASVANISEFHFGRILHSCTGETPGEFLQRHRLQQAFKKIKAQTNPDILDIALSVGYENHSSFSRAFRKYFGISPKEVPIANSNIREPFHPGMSKKARGSGLQPTLVELDKFDVYGITVSGYSRRSFVESAQPAFSKLTTTLSQNKISPDDKKIAGIPLDNTKLTDHDLCRFVAAVKSLDDLTHLGLEKRSFDQGRWAVFDHVGPYTTLWQTWNKAYSQWVVHEGIELRDAPPFEIYEHDQQTPDEKRLTQIHLPIT